MQLGVNFCHDAKQPIGFNLDAVRALRPPIVRVVVSKTADLPRWIREADNARLQVIWCLPETMSITAARTAATIIGTHGLHVTAGLEIGFRPWAFKRSPMQFLRFALAVSAVTAYDDFFTRETRPIVLGAGVDGSPASAAWYRLFIRLARTERRRVSEQFHAFGLHATSPGRPFRRFVFRGVQAQIMDSLRLPIAFTRVGWQLGEPLTLWREFVEFVRTGWNGELEVPLLDVSYEVRRRWLLEAYDHAERLGATHFVIEPDFVRPRSDGFNRWSLYDPSRQTADPVWHTLTWRAARAASRELVAV